MNLDLLVPDIGDFENVEIIEVLVKKGDKINKMTLSSHWRVISQVLKYHQIMKVR